MTYITHQDDESIHSLMVAVRTWKAGAPEGNELLGTVVQMIGAATESSPLHFDLEKPSSLFRPLREWEIRASVAVALRLVGIRDGAAPYLTK